MGCQLFGVIQSHLPKLLYDGLAFRAIETSRTTRAAVTLLSLRLCRTEVYKRSFKVSASKLWNDLPPPIREAQSIEEFKSMLYEYLFTTSLA